MDTKRCAECREALPLTDYYHRRRHPDKDCKRCVNARRAEKRRAAGISPKNSATDGTKLCRDCKQRKPIDEFGRDGQRGLKPNCLPCMAAFQRRKAAAISAGEWESFGASSKWLRLPITGANHGQAENR